MKILSGGAAVISLAEFTSTEGTRRFRTPISAAMGARDIAQTVSVYSPGLAPSRRNTVSEETLYLLRGSGRCNINGCRYDLHPGTAVYIPPAAAYQIANTSEEEMEIVSVCCPEEKNAEMDVTIFERQVSDAPALTLHESERESIPVSDRTFKYLVNDEVGCRQITQFLGFIPPGRAPMHYHTYEEAIYIIEGEGRVHIQGESANFRAGSSIYLPRGVRHSLENTGATAIRLLGVFHPSGSPAVAYEDEEVKKK
ncbi:MAG TPA: cupin domain-containing protein [Blastocatellia bacterium]|jgi:mannose-6-phosphate isomerase-like protein (cupin superfamily)